MPYKSEAQRRAMYAAKEGKSTLGIPASVGAEFVAAGPARGKLPERLGASGGRSVGIKAKKSRQAPKAPEAPSPRNADGQSLGSLLEPRGR